MRNYFNVTFILLLLISCNKIENSKTLDKKDIEYIKSLGLLQDDELIYGFYSQFKNSVAGNFFTNKRVASYWIDKRNANKNEVKFAYYNEIIKIDTVYNVGVTYSPYLLVTKTNDSTFKVSVDGKKEEIKAFYEGAIREWKKKNQKVNHKLKTIYKNKPIDDFNKIRYSSEMFIIKLYKLDNPEVLEDTTKVIWKDEIISSKKRLAFNILLDSVKNGGYCCCPKTNFTISFYKKGKELKKYNVDTISNKDKALFFDKSYQSSYLIPLKKWKEFLKEK